MNAIVNQPDIVAIVNGDSQEFAKLVDSYKDLVFTVAFRMLKNREEAEEVAQDSFIKIFKSLKSFQGDSKLSTWIYRIAYNTCLDRIKKNKIGQNSVPITEVSNYQVVEMNNALDTMLKQEKSEMIKKCIQKLNPADAAILTLFYFEEQSLNELGSTLNLSMNTAKVKLFRARKRLAVILKEQLKPETIRSYE
ncbi:sigma-70 family RNA polymerase sigma factor [uncultured Allomuricauda sp.]|uniref:RNA polymerase sigma factor n=1 Tax=Flagellimonas sp. W118 TaxID=3410791 RepID=UPI0026052A75|nr:sigma-70 family RNA polymerase sigma factor [uncultured Allomuricauda sp.]